jgi:membrane-associated protease RseP (regulator of RpoE activity)
LSLGVVLFIVALLVVIMIHEAGHFIAAKLLGFKATKFFVGFGPTLWSIKRGETEYGIKAIPAGGFVKIVGMNPYEEVPIEDQPRAYQNRPRWQRAIMIAAGPATHWPLAFLILVITAMTIGFPTGEPTNTISAIETRVEGNATPAAEAGFLPDDTIVAINDEPVESWADTRRAIRNAAGEPTSFTIERDGETLEINTTVGRALFDADDNLVAYAAPGEDLRAPAPGETEVGFLGVQPAERFDTMSLGAAIVDSGKRTGELTVFLVTTIGQPFETVFNGDLFEALRGEGPRDPEEGPVGIVGAGRIAGESVEKGRYTDFIGLMVGLTIFVGLINLLPLPPLDGGHLAVIAYESITRRRVDVRKLIPIAAAVISFFVLLFFAVLYLDLARPLRVPL